MSESHSENNQAANNQVTLEDAHQIAVRFLQAGNLMLAERTYRDILKTYPDDFKANHFLGIVCYQRGNIEDALAYIEHAATLNDQDIDCLNNLAIMQSANGMNEEAYQTWDKAIALAPNFSGAYSNKGHALWMDKRYEEAEALCRKAVELDPQNVDARLNLGNALAKLDRLEEAIEEWKITAEQAPQYSKPWNNMGNAYRDLGKLKEAEECCRKAIELDPDNAEAHNNLANALRDQGNPAEAEPLYRRAVALNPEYTQAHNNLAICLIDQNRFDEAAAAARYAVAFDKKYAAAYSTLTHALIESGRFDEAEDAAEKALRYSKDKTRAYLDLADLYFLRDRYEDAEAALEEAVKLSEQSPQTLMKLATIYEHTNKIEEALEEMGKAIEMAPEMPEVYIRRAGIYLINNYIDEARADIEKALEINPKYLPALNSLIELQQVMGEKEEVKKTLQRVREIDPDALVCLTQGARLKKYTSADDPDIQKLEEKISGTVALSNNQISAVHYALYGAYENVSDFEKAFEHLKAANDIKAMMHPYPRLATENSLRRMKNKYSPQRIAELSGKGSASDIPVFIVGMPRSGTTLTEQIISSHPDVFGAGELPDLQIVENRLGEVTPDNAKEQGDLYVELVQKRADHDGYKRITDKMPANFFRLGQIAAILPNAKIIHCRRNPLDTCLSCYKQNFARGQYFSYKLEDLAHHYRQYLDIMEYWRSVLPGRFLEIDYEETVDNFEEQARKLIEYVGLDWNDACLQPHKQKRSVLTASKEQVRKPIYKTSIEAWRRYEKQLQPLVDALGPEITRIQS